MDPEKGQDLTLSQQSQLGLVQLGRGALALYFPTATAPNLSRPTLPQLAFLTQHVLKAASINAAL